MIPPLPHPPMPPPPPARKLPPPPPPPPRRRLELAGYWNMFDFLGEVWLHSHLLEPMEVSLRRLEAAIIADDVFDRFCPGAVWYAYKHHPELGQLLPRNTPSK